MAIRTLDENPHYPTESIVLKRLRKHYRIAVRSPHWQLRSLISAEKQNIVYFPGGFGSNHIQRLNTVSQQSEVVKLLTFSPRCLVAENGWVCCGGEHGEFTAVKVEPAAAADVNTRRDSELASLSNLDFGANPGSMLSLLSWGSRTGNGTSKSVIAKSMTLAKDRINCVTLWFPPTNAPVANGAYKEPVAVLANNDKTVTIVSLRDFDAQEKTDPLEVITYPDFVNRAVISPDGRLLIAILDDPYLYIHERAEKAAGDFTSHRSPDNIQYRWAPCGTILLKSQRRDDESESRGSFAACFSSSGTYLAVGTQYGTISIFDARRFTNPTEDPFITSFKSSRPGLGPGAVRDMAFCPGPYDLLAWTEDRGHIGVADVRSNFVMRQILDITKSDDFEHIAVLDRNTIDPRLLEARGDREARSNSPFDSSSLDYYLNFLDWDQFTRDAITNQSASPLTSEEFAVLEALQTQRRRREAREQRQALREAEASGRSEGTTRRTATHTAIPVPWAERPARRTGATDTRTGRLDSELTRALDDVLGNMRDARRRAQQTATNASRRAETPQWTRAAVLGPTPQWTRSLLETGLRSEERAGERTDARAGERGGESSSERTDEQAGERAGNAASPGRRPRGTRGLAGLLDLETVYFNNTDDLREDLRDRLWNEMYRRRPTDAPLTPLRPTEGEEAAIRRTVPDHAVQQVPPEPDNTSGLSWSEDGRVLFVGAEDGIYEFRVNVQARKLCPSISMR